ncbi:hypothetical protein ElyMa_004709900 [Elysia marginata]|uniref:ShKT domain-containing protein n=1 Tax=Elysia marginata TaxID=1093978 RepID=A0AAV4IDD3_9GAST|nr:hypothetical protein ElyMa_004709900 [Elysia marginata]
MVLVLLHRRYQHAQFYIDKSKKIRGKKFRNEKSCNQYRDSNDTCSDWLLSPRHVLSVKCSEYCSWCSHTGPGTDSGGSNSSRGKTASTWGRPSCFVSVGGSLNNPSPRPL